MKSESKFEGWQWVAAVAAGIAAISVISPHHLGVLVWTMTQVGAGAVAGYWIDRTMFPNARPGDLESDAIECRHARYRRAGIIIASTIGATVGV